MKGPIPGQKKASTETVDAQNSRRRNKPDSVTCKLQVAIIHLGILLLRSSSDIERVPLRKTARTLFLLQVGFASPRYFYLRARSQTQHFHPI
jgi:hypothetical protein